MFQYTCLLYIRRTYKVKLCDIGILATLDLLMYVGASCNAVKFLFVHSLLFILIIIIFIIKKIFFHIYCAEMCLRYKIIQIIARRRVIRANELL